MKKTGRVVLGTIGLILSLALAGGTVVYGTMFHKNAVAEIGRDHRRVDGEHVHGLDKDERVQ